MKTANANVTILTDDTFDAEVLEADKLTLVDFWATWCSPCKTIAPVIDAIAVKYKDQLKVAKMDIDEHGQIAHDYRVSSIPTLLLFKNGKVVGQVVGAVSQRNLEAVIGKHL